MDVVQLLILAALGLLGRVLSGLVDDGGGGIIFVPALVYAAGPRGRAYPGRRGSIAPHLRPTL